MSEPSERERQPSMFSAEDFPVSPTPLLADEAALRMNATSGPSSPVSFARYDRDGSWVKTSQGFSQVTLDGFLERFSETWPRAGMTRNGSAYRRRPLVPRISATGFGYLPTPDKSIGLNQFKRGGVLNHSHDLLTCFRKETTGLRPSGAKIGNSLRWCPEFIREWLRTGGDLNPRWLEVLMGYPMHWTDVAHWATRSSRKSRNGSRGASSKRKA